MAQLDEEQVAFIRDNPYYGVVTTLETRRLAAHDRRLGGRRRCRQTSGSTRRAAARSRATSSATRGCRSPSSTRATVQWVSVTGTAQLVDEGADAQIDKLAKKYLDADSYPFRKPEEQRVSVPIDARADRGARFRRGVALARVTEPRAGGSRPPARPRLRRLAAPSTPAAGARRPSTSSRLRRSSRTRRPTWRRSTAPAPAASSRRVERLAQDRQVGVLLRQALGAGLPACRRRRVSRRPRPCHPA